MSPRERGRPARILIPANSLPSTARPLEAHQTRLYRILFHCARSCAGVPPAQGLARLCLSRPLHCKDNHSPLEGESQKPSRTAKADAVGGEHRPPSFKAGIHKEPRRGKKICRRRGTKIHQGTRRGWRDTSRAAKPRQQVAVGVSPWEGMQNPEPRRRRQQVAVGVSPWEEMKTPEPRRRRQQVAVGVSPWEGMQPRAAKAASAGSRGRKPMGKDAKPRAAKAASAPHPEAPTPPPPP